jgi:hypothetical protein
MLSNKLIEEPIDPVEAGLVILRLPLTPLTQARHTRSVRSQTHNIVNGNPPRGSNSGQRLGAAKEPEHPIAGLSQTDDVGFHGKSFLGRVHPSALR